MPKPEKIFTGKTAIVAGGSKGIGRAVAKEFVKNGGSVCIIARNKDDLNTAANSIEKARFSKGQSVTAISCDTTNLEKLKPLMENFIKKNGVPDYLMNFVGYAYPNYIQDLKLEDFKKNMDINYYGQLVPILILLPYYMKERKGHIVTCSSVLGFMGMMGYATYSPSKFAIWGLTESLRNEMKPYNIRFSILFPPDTDTPGFKKENETKPAEVHIMSESGGLLSPEKVAEKFMKDLINDKFYIMPGQSRLLWTITRHFPNLAHTIMDNELKKAVKKKVKKSK
jgi:3-dehydrosphinganine reductase